MESKATAKYIKTSPQKARLVVDAVRGKRVDEALTDLKFSIKKSVSLDVEKLIKSAVANMQSKESGASVDAEDLFIKEIYVDAGPSMGRFRARSQGRVGKIIKRSCHITVKLSN